MNVFIHHQYEILYFLGAFFSLCYMVSYLEFTKKTAVSNLSEKSVTDNMNSSEQFYDGFENPDFTNLYSDDSPKKKAVGDG